MKLSVSPEQGGTADSLADLADLIERAVQQVGADPSTRTEQVSAKVRVSVGGRVKAVELSW